MHLSCRIAELFESDCQYHKPCLVTSESSHGYTDIAVGQTKRNVPSMLGYKCCVSLLCSRAPVETHYSKPAASDLQPELQQDIDAAVIGLHVALLVTASVVCSATGHLRLRSAYARHVLLCACLVVTLEPQILNPLWVWHRSQRRTGTSRL